MEPIVFVIQKAQLNPLRKKRDRKGKIQDRPDIVHQCLLTLLDSPLNKTGKLRIYVHTTNNVLIEVNPAARLPRTSNRFNGLMSQLLANLKIKSTTGETLLRIIRNPVSIYLPPNTVKVSLSKEGVKMDKNEILKRKGRGYTFFINAIASGEDPSGDVDVWMKVSDFGLSAALCCAKVCNIFEEIHNIF